MLLRRRRTSPPAQRRGHSPHAPTRPKELPAQLLRRLEFKVLRRLDGFLFGDYTGTFFGPSLDLAEVREYQAGDEVRRIDWNVTARTGTIHVRQYREEREVTAWILVDLSPSMNFGTRRVLKRDEALEFVATAAAIVTRHGDKVGVLGFSNQGLKVVIPGSGRRQTLRILNELFALINQGDTGEKWTLEKVLEYAAKTLRRKALVFVVSDFISPDPSEAPAWSRVLRHLAYKHDVIAVQVSDPAERELPKAGELRLRDPESGQEIWLDTSDPRVRAAHARLVVARKETLERTLRSARVDLLSLSTEKEIVEPLLKFTLRRRGRR